MCGCRCAVHVRMGHSPLVLEQNKHGLELYHHAGTDSSLSAAAAAAYMMSEPLTSCSWRADAHMKDPSNY